MAEEIDPKAVARLEEILLRKRVDRNYNYNDNSTLAKAIAEGYRGAFGDILRRISP